MDVVIVTPAPAGSRSGNRMTAQRIGRMLRERHRVTVTTAYYGKPCDVVIALHAYKSAGSVETAHARGIPTVVMLTGTDIYGSSERAKTVQATLRRADRIVSLQRLALNELPRPLKAKARFIVQSARRLTDPPPPLKRCFEISVSGHLRSVKDPFRAAMASRLLEADSKIRVTHVGKALSASFAERAKREQQNNSRYVWLGEQPHWRALRIVARSRALVISSKSEGGANVASEAIANQTPILASKIDGNVALLGDRYPGYFPFGDTRSLANLMERCEKDSVFYGELCQHIADLTQMVLPKSEQQGWLKVLASIENNAARPRD